MFYAMFLFLILAIIMTFYLKFPQFKCFKSLLKSKNKKTKQTFLLGLATNLGVGNLIGVSAALYYGGPGVIFWMFIFAFFSSSFAYLETYYAIKSQEIVNGELRSGTSFVINRYLDNKIGLVLSIVFASFLLITNSVIFPSIQIYSIINVFPTRKTLIGLFLFIMIVVITFKGINMIIKVTDFILPFVAIIYTFTIITLILLKTDNLCAVLNEIVRCAFTKNSLFVSSIFITIQVGISKSLFSNEAGLGTMPSLTGIADKKEIEHTCNFQVLSVLIDTVVLCSLTGIFILQNITNLKDYQVSNILLKCFELNLGKFGLVIYRLFIVLFGFSSVIGQFYLGESNASFFDKFFKNKVFKNLFRILFYIGIIAGMFFSFDTINNILDMGMIILGIINLMVLFTIEIKQKNNKNT